ncbi:catalase family protein [Leptothrix discophora]|uniref:Catalase family protein n=1 Tax=Leptothrix discophora TaxID=89 RepID=A0ABT9G4L6_LEPDI|nr:catalase family protein [Leptothrix discophora]MDP4301433.1 catalase family protein [Leptothrix discophora]
MNRPPPAGALERALHGSLVRLMQLERRVDPLVRPALDSLLREPLTRVVQALIRLQPARVRERPGEETPLPGEEACVDAIVRDMRDHMHRLYRPGEYERAGNTKTHGVVRAELRVHDGLPEALRHGLFATPRRYPAWVRFGGPGPASPPDIDDVGVLSLGVKVMDVPGPKLMDDERHTQDLTGISTPVFTTPDVIANAQLQAMIRRGTPLWYFLRGHLLDSLMQALWSRTQTSPLETGYWGCVPYRLGPEAVMQYQFRPLGDGPPRAVPGLPGRPSPNYLREALAATLRTRDAAFELCVQRQVDARHTPIENASVRWSERLSPPVPVATLHIPQQVFDSPAQLAFAHRLSIHPWHALEAHRPLGNQNRARRRIYEELSRLRQAMNGTPHVEPDGSETFDA